MRYFVHSVARHAARAAAGSALLAFALTEPSFSQTNQINRQVWTGAIAAQDGWLTYAGATTAPSGHIHNNGVRFRAVTGHGEFTYYSRTKLSSPWSEEIAFRGRATFADILSGYLVQYGPLTVTAFAGVSIVDNAVDDKLQHVDKSAGTEVGPKLALELWYDDQGPNWFSLNFAGSTAHNTYSLASRTGYKVLPELSLGTEIMINGNGLDPSDRDESLARLQTRTGAFVRYTWGNSEVSLSGGISGDVVQQSVSAPYGALNWATSF